MIKEELNILQQEEFDIEVQKCNTSDCLHDCTTITTNECNYYKSKID